MATIKFIYRSDKEDANGEAPLYLRIYHAKKLRHKKTDIYLREKHWNEDKQQIRKSHPKAKKLNLHLSRWKGRARDAIHNADPLTAKNIKYQLEGINPNSYFDYLDKILPSFSYDYQKLITAATNHLRKFAPDLYITGVDVSLLKSFERHLLKKVSQNTANEYMAVIRRILNRAIDDEIITPNDSPFVRGRFSMSWEDTDPTPLSWEQFITLRDCDPPKDLQLYKDMFLFSCYMDGMRLTDVLTFKTSTIKGGKSKYQMSKTGKRKQITIVPAARDIIERYQGGYYLFPLLNKKLKGDAKKDEIRRLTSKIWGKVKRLGKEAGLDTHLHFHMARNTSGYIAYKNGWSLPEIQEMYRHSTIQQTRDYLGKMAPEEIDQKRDDMWS